MTLTKHHLLSPLALIALMVGGCGGSSPPKTETLYKSVEGIQCEPPRVTLRQLDDELAAAGLDVTLKACAWDGLGRTAVCGAGTAYLRVIQIDSTQVERAKVLGYVSPSDYPAATPMACPSK